jgi:glycosyltransferase involved in cell wall biosynthesis
MAAIVDDALVKTPSFEAPISLVRDSLSAGLNQLDPQSDLIHLHWLNGVSDISRVAKSFPGVPIVWTLHDMNPYTGVCHQSLGCSEYQTGCGTCPAVRGIFQKRVVQHFEKKANQLRDVKIALVAPSQWLATQARQSPITAGHAVRVIPNPLDPSWQKEHPKSDRSGSDQRRIVVIASDLSDPLKGVGKIVEAHQSLEDLGNTLELVLVGSRGDQWQTAQNVLWTGALQKTDLQELLSTSDYVASASLAESFGLSIIEGAASGALPLVPSSGALEEVRSALGAGMAFSNEQELRSCLEQIARKPRPAERQRSELKKSSHKLYSAETVERHYSKIYAELGVIQ